jgi:hypothetical protein
MLLGESIFADGVVIVAVLLAEGCFETHAQNPNKKSTNFIVDWFLKLGGILNRHISFHKSFRNDFANSNT